MDIKSQGFLCLFKNLNVNIMWMIVYVFKFCVSICIYYMFGMQTSIHLWLKVLILPIKCSFKQLHIDICWPHPPLQRLLPLTSKLFVPNLCHVYYLIRFWQNSVGNFFGAKFFLKIWMWFFQGQTLFWTYVRSGWSDWCETKRKCIGWKLDILCDLNLWPWPWPWIFQGKISK